MPPDRFDTPGREQRELELADALTDEELVAEMDYNDELACTHCGGGGECEAGTDPLGLCTDEPHRCHACGGSGARSDQRVF